MALLFLVGAAFAVRALLSQGDQNSDEGTALPTAVAPQGKEYAQPALEYLNMVKRGDAASIKKMREESVGTEDTTQLLTPEIMRTASKNLTNIKLEEGVEPISGMTTGIAKVSYDISGRHYVEDFSVEKVDDKWKLSRFSLPEVRVTTSRKVLTVNGQKITLPASDSDYTTLVATPGVYSFNAAKSKYFTGGSGTAKLGGGDSIETPEVNLEDKLTPAFAADASKLVNSYLTSCAKTPDKTSSCPLYASAGTTWKMTRLPTYSFSEGINDGEYRVSSETNGTAQWRRTYAGYTTDGTRTFNVYGTIVMAGNKLTYKPL